MSQVLYWKDEFSRDLLMGYEWCRERGRLPDLANLNSTHVYLMDVHTENLEEIFRQMQGEIWAAKGNERRLIRAKGLSHTSMSVGDVVILSNGQAWIGDLVGFRQL